MLTIRESARLQGFPDYFQFCGTIKERYLLCVILDKNLKTRENSFRLVRKCKSHSLNFNIYRYCQIGNAVAVSVSRALGYSLGMAFRGLASGEHLIKLPQNFSHSTYPQLQETIPH